MCIDVYNSFYNELLPGNYALTKSMELTNVQTSGSLWYTKKFLVLYYFIFLTDDIYTREYIDKVVALFDNYINSLDEQIRESAKKFFYTDNERTNFKSNEFITFSSFTRYDGFNNTMEKQEYDRNARKYYFALLMGVGGQTGIKKILKETIQQEGFIFSLANIRNAIKNAAIKMCIQQSNSSHVISDNSVKYVISQNAINEILELSASRIIDEKIVNEKMAKYPHDDVNCRGIINDFIAFIRNQRQILYYYGFFHSKSSGATDFEFSSLTPVGHTAIKANFYEFLAIWEHQKIKMISQPPVVDINNLSPVGNCAEKFGISYTPYVDIIGSLVRRNDFSINEYKYIISRRKHTINETDWEHNEETIFNHFSDISSKINTFNRKRDLEDEDGRKELLKYLLGIRSDLSLDMATNSLGCCQFKNGKVNVTNQKVIQMLYIVYAKLSEYKVRKNHELFDRCEQDLRRKYKASVNGQNTSTDPKVKIDWDLYNIREDKFIMLATIFTIASAQNNINLLKATNDEKQIIIENTIKKFTTILKNYSLTTPIKIKSAFSKVVACLKNGDYSAFYDAPSEEHMQFLEDYRNVSTADLFARIKDISRNQITVDGERQRNRTLVDLLKTYYMTRFEGRNALKCECCGQQAIIGDSGLPYVEFHHLIPFNIASGPDHYLNLFALCPNCHSIFHVANVTIKETEYKKIDINNYLQLSIIIRLQTLKNEHILQSYHLEYLLAERAITQDQYNQIAT